MIFAGNNRKRDTLINNTNNTTINNTLDDICAEQTHKY